MRYCKLFPLLFLLTRCGPEAPQSIEIATTQKTTQTKESIPPPQHPIHFADASATSGLKFINVSGSYEQNYVVESMSAGAAFLDYDNDGWLDLFIVNGTRLEYTPNGARNRLYHNELGNIANPAEQTFRQVDVDLESGAWGMGCAVGDYDNDGDADLYVTYWGPNQLWRNDGETRFVEVAKKAGVDDPGWGSSAAFGDLDADGLLDLYVTNYLKFDLKHPPAGGEKCLYKGLSVYCGPEYLPRQADRLYRNTGDGQFADMSAATGVADLVYPGMGLVFADLDWDGDLDLYIGNDTEPNALLRNDGNWNFVEVAASAGAAYSGDGTPQASMGIHAGDFDNDGDLDLFSTHFSDDFNTLYRNDGSATWDSGSAASPDLRFQDITHQAGLSRIEGPYLGWGTAFVDFDNDGWLDLFVANGHVYPQLDQSFSGLQYAQRNLLYHNIRGHFTEIGAKGGKVWDVQKVSRAAAVGDYDNDGDADLFFMNLNDSPTLLRNESAAGNNWLGLKLVGVESNRDAIGAQVRVFAGDLRQVREVQRGYSFQAQNDPRLLFGLGQNDRVDRVEIRWPSGRRQQFTKPPLRQYLQVREGRDELIPLGP